MYISVDANFKLKRKVSKNLHDIGLADGMSIFAESSAYNEHLEQYTDEAEVYISVNY
jgi:hypothetical protein